MATSSKKVKATHRDIFFHFLAMFTLYISAISLTVVLFQIINISFPDPVSDQYYAVDRYRRALRSGLSFLIVMFPVMIFSLRMLAKTYKDRAVARALSIRKTITYFTLFVVSFIIMFTLVFVLNQFLDGELTSRFAFKALSTLLVAGAIFWYYRLDLRDIQQAET